MRQGRLIPFRLEFVPSRCNFCCGRLAGHSASAGAIARVGPTSMRMPLSRPERDDHGTTQTSIRHHPHRRSAMKEYAVAPFTPAASQCAMSDLGMQPQSRSRS